MQIAVTGEGPTDYGKRDYNTREWLEGPIQQYMRKVATEIIGEEQTEAIEFPVLERDEIKKLRFQKSIRGLSGKSVPAKKFAIWMKQNNIEKGVFYCDADREGGVKNSSHEAVKRYKEVYDEVALGLTGTEAIPMIALRIIECWILGDIDAIEEALEISINKNVNKPEFLWGDKHNPRSNYPKNYLERLVREADRRYRDFEGNREDFVEIAKCSDKDKMNESCPVSYGKFYQDFTNMIS